MTSIIKVDQIQLTDGNTPTAADLGLNVTGSVLQVKSFQQAVGQTQVTASTVWVYTGCGVSITPSSTSSKVLVLVSGAMIANNTNSYEVRVQRDGTVINLHEMYHNDTTWTGDSVSLVCLDSPSSTSSVSYTVDMRSQINGNNNYLRWNYQNQSGSTSTITVMEIAG